VPNSPIPITVVRFGADVESKVLEVLRSGVVAQGPVVKQLETEFADLIGVEHVVAVNNGTTALIAAIDVLDLEPGDEVITSPFTFVATLNAIIAAGATARFSDIGYADFNVDPNAMADTINPNTKALLPVHLYGQCADMESIVKLADVGDLRIIEDAAQAHGASIGKRSAGSWGIGCFSLYATKNVTSGEGGLISTDSDDIADRLRILRNQGMRERYQYEMAGNNFRLTDLQAALCVPQLVTYEANVAARRRNAVALTEGLSNVPGVVAPQEVAGRHHVWHQYTVLIEDGARLTRDELIDGLTSEGIGCGIYYPKLVFDYDCYRGHPQVKADDFPVASDVVRRCVSLPVHQYLTDGEIDRIVTTMSTLMGS